MINCKPGNVKELGKDFRTWQDDEEEGGDNI
jgi:hypothetical protein